MKKVLLFAIINFFFSILVFADGVEFSASAPNTVEVGERFYLTYTSNSRAKISLPQFTDFSLVGGPSTSSSSSIQIINGQTTQSTSFTYSYVLQAKAEGTFTIPAATASINGKSYSCNTVTINVVKQGSKPSQPQQSSGRDPWGRQDPYSQQQQQQVTGEDIFIRMHVDRTNIYQGEPIVATLKIYTRLDLMGFEDFVLPDYKGFWVQEFEMPEQISLQRETVNGVPYNTAVLKKDLLYPQYSGTLEIKPAEVVCMVRQRVSGGNSPWDAFFGYYENKSVSVKSSTVNINVKALPDNAPGYFSGAVGNFSLKTEVSDDSVQTNDAITIKLIVSGTGNIKLIDPPGIKFPKEFEVYDPEIKLNVNTAAGGNSGSKTFEYTLIPRYPGNFNIGNIRFAYFDPAAGRYKTLQSESISVFVKRGLNDDEGNVSSSYSKENIDYIGEEDIQFIKLKPFKLKKERNYLMGSPLFILLLSVPLLLFGVVILVLRKRIKESANIAKMRNKKANKTSMKRLKHAREFMNNNKREEFYKEVMTALWGYLGDKLDIAVADISKDNVSEKLNERGISDNYTQEFLNIIELCEYAHFAPATEETRMQNVYNEAVKIINQLEQQLK
ncbi:MAG TPA: BatD family protein [Bacteroidales bacterium]|nr:BatD family protein [Bacteroidales bacterium]